MIGNPPPDGSIQQIPSSFGPVEYDSNNVESLVGMQFNRPTTHSQAGEAIQTGNPSIMERMTFGGLADGSPVMSYVDDNGNRQTIRVSAGQWVSALNRRDDNRRELQFRMDADERRGELAAQWNSLISNGDFTQYQNDALSLLWQVSPNDAIKQFAAMQAGNTERRMMTEVVGGVEMFGEDGWKELVASAEQVGIPLPMIESHSQLVQFATAVEEARRQEAKDKRTQFEMYRGEPVPRTSMPWLAATEALSYGRRMLWHGGLTATLAQQGGAAQAEHKQSVLDLQTLIRSHEMMSHGDMTLAQRLNFGGQTRTASDNGRTLATGLYLMGAWEGVSFEYKPDGTVDMSSEHNAEQTQRVIDSINTMSRQMGWVDMGTTDADGNTVYTKEEKDLIDAVIAKGRDHYGKAPRGYTEYVAEQAHQAAVDRAHEIRQEDRDAQREWNKRIDEAKLKVITGGGDFSAEQLAELERMRRQGPGADPLAGLNVGPSDVERRVHTGEGASNWSPGQTETVTEKATGNVLHQQFVDGVGELLDDKTAGVVADALGLSPDDPKNKDQIVLVLLEAMNDPEPDASTSQTKGAAVLEKLRQARNRGEFSTETMIRIRSLAQEYLDYQDE